MDIQFLIILCVALAGLVYFYPRLPQIGQLIAAIAGFIVCAVVLLKYLGVNVGL